MQPALWGLQCNQRYGSSTFDAANRSARTQRRQEKSKRQKDDDHDDQVLLRLENNKNIRREIKKLCFPRAKENNHRKLYRNHLVLGYSYI